MPPRQYAPKPVGPIETAIAGMSSRERANYKATVTIYSGASYNLIRSGEDMVGALFFWRQSVVVIPAGRNAPPDLIYT